MHTTNMKSKYLLCISLFLLLCYSFRWRNCLLILVYLFGTIHTFYLSLCPRVRLRLSRLCLLRRFSVLTFQNTNVIIVHFSDADVYICILVKTECAQTTLHCNWFVFHVYSIHMHMEDEHKKGRPRKCPTIHVKWILIQTMHSDAGDHIVNLLV